MFKLLIGFFLGCFITYNYILPNDQYKNFYDTINLYALEFLETLTEELRNNVENN